MTLVGILATAATLAVSWSPQLVSPQQGKEISCHVPSVKLGDPGSVTCNFHFHLSIVKDITITVELYPDNAAPLSPVTVLECYWVDKLDCHVSDGFEFNKSISDKLLVHITKVSANHVGRYVCKIMSKQLDPTPSPQQCRLTLLEGVTSLPLLSTDKEETVTVSGSPTTGEDSTAVIVGVVVAIVVVVALAIILIFIYIRRRRRKQTSSSCQDATSHIHDTETCRPGPSQPTAEFHGTPSESENASVNEADKPTVMDNGSIRDEEDEKGGTLLQNIDGETAGQTPEFTTRDTANEEKKLADVDEGGISDEQTEMDGTSNVNHRTAEQTPEHFERFTVGEEETPEDREESDATDKDIEKDETSPFLHPSDDPENQALEQQNFEGKRLLVDTL